jgi:hypothetical protein
VLLLVLLAGRFVATCFGGREVGRTSALEVVVFLVRISAPWTSNRGGCSLC